MHFKEKINHAYPRTENFDQKIFCPGWDMNTASIIFSAIIFSYTLLLIFYVYFMDPNKPSVHNDLS